MQGMVPPGVDLAKAEIVEITEESGNPRINLTLEDGSRIQIETVVQMVHLIGHDPTNGMPLYGVQTSNVIKLQKVGPKARKAPVASKGNEPARGFG